MPKVWKIKKPPQKDIERLKKEAGISSLLAWLLLNRGVKDANSVREFLSFQLEDLVKNSSLEVFEPPAQLLKTAIIQRKTIGVHGDYDVDGITSTALLLDFLKAVGAKAEYYLPHRLQDGYGLSERGVEELFKKGAKLVVALDCGITDHQAVERAKALGMKVIVIDHHQPPLNLPDADVIIDPFIEGFPKEFQVLCTAGLVFFLLLQLRRLLREEGFFKTQPEPNLKQALDLVALGTVADVALVKGLNRILLSYGFKELERTSRFGLQLLKKKAYLEDEIDYAKVAFRLAPRLNAAGRIDEADPGLELLLCKDAKKANELADILERRNQLRQRLEEKILDQARQQIESWSDLSQRKSLVVWGADWHPGVVGIVAQRLREIYNRPCIVISVSDGLGRGSARGLDGFNLYLGLVRCQKYLLEFGGHELACGLVLPEDNLEYFREEFEQVVEELCPQEAFEPVLFCDAELPIDRITPQLVDELERLKPFGPGNPEPVLVARWISVLSSEWRAEKHLRMLVQENKTTLNAWYFQAQDVEVKPGEVIDLAYTIDASSWQGSPRLRLIVKDLKKLTSG